MRNFYIGIIVVVVLAIGVFVFVQNNNNNAQVASACDSAPVATDSATIRYSNSGFSPSIVSVSSGGTLTVVNDADNTVQFSSDPHPIHTSNGELNIEEIGSGEEKSVTLDKTGCFGYHNHLNSSETGNILVK